MNEFEELTEGITQESLVSILSRGILQREQIIDKLTQINYKHTEMLEGYVKSVENAREMVNRLESVVERLTDEYGSHLKRCEDSRDKALAELDNVRNEMTYLKTLLEREQEINRTLHKEFISFAQGVASASNTSNINVTAPK